MTEAQPEFITEVWSKEVFTLGLQDQPMLIPQEHVKARFGINDAGEGRVVLFVHDIHILKFDYDTQKVDYRIQGVKQYAQNWDSGGCYLDPSEIPMTLA